MLDGHAVVIARQYDSLASGDPGSFGYGWRLALRDTNIQSDVPLTGRESLGDYAPFEAGTRVYVTLPTGDRVGFTFEPVKQSIPGLVYYTPAFVADPGVNWTLQSAATQLSRIGSRFYDLQTGQPYNPAGWSTGTQYTLVAPDGTSYEIDASLGVTGIDFTDGVHFAVSGSGIYAPNGDAVSFVGGTSGITKVIGPDGDQVVYLYDTGQPHLGARSRQRSIGSLRLCDVGSGDGHRQRQQRVARAHQSARHRPAGDRRYTEAADHRRFHRRDRRRGADLVSQLDVDGSEDSVR
jgi:hypothetical protein